MPASPMGWQQSVESLDWDESRHMYPISRVTWNESRHMYTTGHVIYTKRVRSLVRNESYHIHEVSRVTFIKWNKTREKDPVHV